MAIISFGKIDKNLIPIILGCLFIFLSRLLFKVENTKLFKQKIFPNLLASIIKLLTIVPLIITNKNSKNVHSNDNNNININPSFNNSIELIHVNLKISDIIKGKFICIIISTVMQFVQGLLLIYAIGVKSNSWIWYILITTIFYYLIFRVKMFKHHYLSIIIIILIGFVIDISSGNLQNDFSTNLLFLSLKFAREIIYSLLNVIYKYLMEKKYCSVYELSVYTGVINSILFGIMQIIDYYFFSLDNLDEYFDGFNVTEFLVMQGFFITQLGIYLCTLMTIKNYTPCHAFTITVFGQFANYLDFSAISIILIICYIFIFIFSLIFNEIIEINFWGLSKNTKRNIIKRAENEISSLVKKDTFNSVGDNDENRNSLIELQTRDSIY